MDNKKHFQRRFECVNHFWKPGHKRKFVSEGCFYSALGSRSQLSYIYPQRCLRGNRLTQMEVKNDNEAGSRESLNLCPGKQRKTEGCGVLYRKLYLPLSFQVMSWWKIVHLRLRKEDWKVTEGHREGQNEPAQRHQPVITRVSAASYQQLFYSARIRKTKGTKCLFISRTVL